MLKNTLAQYMAINMGKIKTSPLHPMGRPQDAESEALSDSNRRDFVGHISDGEEGFDYGV
jgi:hypothetical protein